MQTANATAPNCLVCWSEGGADREVVGYACLARGCRFDGCRECFQSFDRRCFVCRSPHAGPVPLYADDRLASIAAQFPMAFHRGSNADDLATLTDPQSMPGRLHTLLWRLHTGSLQRHRLACTSAGIGTALAVGLDTVVAATPQSAILSLLLLIAVNLVLRIHLYAPVLHGALPELGRCRSIWEGWRVADRAIEQARVDDIGSFFRFHDVHGLLEISIIMNALGVALYDSSDPHASAKIVTFAARAFGMYAIYHSTPRRMLFTQDAYRVNRPRIET
jgi:hypothetical protein